MNNIFQTLVYQREKKKDTVLATIIWDDGSAPRGITQTCEPRRSHFPTVGLYSLPERL